MKKIEILLTSIPFIHELKAIGLTYGEIANEINNKFGINITQRDIYDSLYYIKTIWFKKKYNDFILLDISEKPSDAFISKTVMAHNLFITTKQIAKHFEYDHLFLTNKDYQKRVSTEEGMIYAKRLLKNYEVSDKELIEYLRKKNPSVHKINYELTIDYLHQNIDKEVSQWIQTLKQYAIDIANSKEMYNAKIL
ncbi:MAG: hypothetical protein OHK0036_20660 [Bacteroidia bacterium]